VEVVTVEVVTVVVVTVVVITVVVVTVHRTLLGLIREEPSQFFEGLEPWRYLHNLVTRRIVLSLGPSQLPVWGSAVNSSGPRT